MEHWIHRLPHCHRISKELMLPYIYTIYFSWVHCISNSAFLPFCFACRFRSSTFRSIDLQVLSLAVLLLKSLFAKDIANLGLERARNRTSSQGLKRKRTQLLPALSLHLIQTLDFKTLRTSGPPSASYLIQWKEHQCSFGYSARGRNT